MRVMFWLSRAFAPCGGTRTPLQLTHSCITLHIITAFGFQCYEYRERTKHTFVISSCQHNLKKRLPALFELVMNAVSQLQLPRERLQWRPRDGGNAKPQFTGEQGRKWEYAGHKCLANALQANK